jgi:hypothetical protein
LLINNPPRLLDIRNHHHSKSDHRTTENTSGENASKCGRIEASSEAVDSEIVDIGRMDKEPVSDAN